MKRSVWWIPDSGGGAQLLEWSTMIVSVNASKKSPLSGIHDTLYPYIPPLDLGPYFSVSVGFDFQLMKSPRLNLKNPIKNSESVKLLFFEHGSNEPD